ncbi:hypothetical protein ENSA5_43320 [Enhygromyxa salina]|uniref:Class I SAM-dependent methyltransferase n=1 Tax=Enhygromyxa salina TaxID=215803 RepID=A0A2S9XKP4_9BACT|nr:class I SAM-dependent methyltransferase [Enhygromyxa salina]PRP93310.1 hypothetical protein ENSA5_43320 [Enhygromyxa salina]
MIRAALPYLGDNLLMLADVLTELELAGIDEPVLLRASEGEKLERILAHGTDRAGYPGDRRWRHDPAIAHEDVILATTPQENRDGEAEPERSTSLKKFAVIDAPLLLIYEAAALERLRPKEYRFVDPRAKLGALRAVFTIAKHALPEGWLRPAEGMAYRAVVERALDPSGAARGVVVEVGCWLGRSTSYIARLCHARGARLVCVDTWAGSSDRFDAAYRELLAARDVEAEFAAHLDALGVRVERRRVPSVEAAAGFERGSVDLVFLDASHDEAAVAEDIAAWRPKLRPGGVLAGHDYAESHPGVIAAVDRAARGLGCAVRRGPGSLWWFE